MTTTSLARVYGFLMMLTAEIAAMFYLFLALAPNSVALEVLGENFQSIRQASLTLLVVLGVTIVYVFSSYALLIAVNTPPITDTRWVTDQFARKWDSNTANLADIPKSVWTKRLLAKN